MAPSWTKQYYHLHFTDKEPQVFPKGHRGPRIDPRESDTYAYALYQLFQGLCYRDVGKEEEKWKAIKRKGSEKL